MTDADKQLWKSIREIMVNGELDSDRRIAIRLPKDEFNLLYGEVNAKCSAEVLPVCVRCGSPYTPSGQCSDHEHCQGGRGESGFIGQEPAAQVLRHADTVESWNAEEILKREG